MIMPALRPSNRQPIVVDGSAAEFRLEVAMPDERPIVLVSSDGRLVYLSDPDPRWRPEEWDQ